MAENHKQRFFVLHFAPSSMQRTETLDELNGLLDDGWEPVRETPMGAAGGGPNLSFASLVLLQKADLGARACDTEISKVQDLGTRG